jgi:serine/threonine protein kinase
MSTEMLPMPPPPLSELGRYQLAELLGRGGMAEVYKAKLAGAAGINRMVAVKRMLPEARQHAEYVEMFIREARVCSRMMHPNLIQIFELCQTDDELFLAMELVEGPDLRKVLNANLTLGKAVPLEFALCIANGILRGLDAAHRLNDDDGHPLGVVHRDLSPANVLLSYEGAIKVADFGVAHSTENTPTAGESDKIKGKLQYMAPEQIVGLPLDLRVDVFCAAAVIYEMVTGHPLYPWTDAADVVRRVAGAQFPPILEVAPHLEPLLAQAITKGLAAQAGDRYPSCEAFAAELGRLIQQGKVPCAPESELALYLQVLAPKQPFHAELVHTPAPRLPAANLEGPTAETRRPSGPAQPVRVATPGATSGLRPVGGAPTSARPAIAPPQGSFSPGSRPPSHPTPLPIATERPPSRAAAAPSAPAGARPPSKPTVTPPAKAPSPPPVPPPPVLVGELITPAPTGSNPAIPVPTLVATPQGSSPNLKAQVQPPPAERSSPRLKAQVHPAAAPPAKRPMSGGDLSRPATPAPKRPDSGRTALDALLVAYLAGDTPAPVDPVVSPPAKKDPKARR